MKLQRIAIILLVMGLVVGLEAVLMNHFSKDDGAPVATAEPVSTDQAMVMATNQPAPATEPPQVGFTSPPSNAGSSGVSTTTTTTNDASSNNSSSDTTQSQPTTPPATPAPTLPPKPTDPPVSGSVVNSGSFVSNTGVGMNTSISWQAADQGDGTTRIYLTGDVNSYSLDVMGRSVTISFAGYSTTVTSSGITVPSTNSMVSSHLFFATLDVPTGTAGDMTVSWDYNGEYSGTSISAVTATGYVSA